MYKNILSARSYYPHIKIHYIRRTVVFSPTMGKSQWEARPGVQKPRQAPRKQKAGWECLT